MHRLLSVDVAIPVIGQTLNLLVPRNVVGGALLDTVDELIQDKFRLTGSANLYFADYGTMIDYTQSLENIPNKQGVKLILM